MKLFAENGKLKLSKNGKKAENLSIENSPVEKHYVRKSDHDVIKDYLEKIFESVPVVILMTLLTIWALYSTDIKLAATSQSSDQGFEIAISIAFFLFLIEIFAQIVYKDDYLHIPSWKPEQGETILNTWWRRMQIGSFYFWLDWIATLSLLFEV